MDQIPKAVKGTVQAMLDKKDERKVQESICTQFGMLLFLDFQLLAIYIVYCYCCCYKYQKVVVAQVYG